MNLNGKLRKKLGGQTRGQQKSGGHGPSSIPLRIATENSPKNTKKQPTENQKNTKTKI